MSNVSWDQLTNPPAPGELLSREDICYLVALHAEDEDGDCRYCGVPACNTGAVIQTALLLYDERDALTALLNSVGRPDLPGGIVDAPA